MRRLASASRGDELHADRAFVRRIAQQLGERGSAAAPELIAAITERYAGEIKGHFDRRIHGLVTSALPIALTALLNGTSPGQALIRVHELRRLSDRLRIGGEVDRLRRLSAIGTIIVAPTHVSNLDSVVVGYASNASAGCFTTGSRRATHWPSWSRSAQGETCPGPDLTPESARRCELAKG